MFSVKDNDCVGFDSKWKVKRVYNENTSQTNECSPFEVSTSTSTTSEIQTQTDEQEVKTEASDVDMQKLADWLTKIYPKVNKELNESVNSKAFYGGYSFQQPDLIAEAKLLQTLNVVSKSREKDLAFRVNAISWNSTGNSLAVSCNHLHKSWCHHSGQVSVYTFNRNDKLPDIPSKNLTVSGCVTILRFHPSVPSIIAIGSHSGEITIWNIQHDEGDGIVAKVNGHDETVTQMIWMYDINTYKSLLLATSSIDGYLNLWNFNLTSSQLTVKQRYKIKSPVLAKVRSSNASEELARKVVRGILSFDFSTYVPDLFIVGVEGGLVVQCSMLGVNQLKGSTPELPVSDPVFKYYEPHEGEIQTIRCSPNRRDLFMTSANDGEIRIYVIGQDAPARVIFFDQQLNQVSWVPYQEKLICGCGHKGIIEIFDLINNKQITNITSEKVVPTALLQLEVNKQRCTTVAVGNDKGEIQLWTIPWSSFAVQTAE